MEIADRAIELAAKHINKHLAELKDLEGELEKGTTKLAETSFHAEELEANLVHAQEACVSSRHELDTAQEALEWLKIHHEDVMTDKRCIKLSREEAREEVSFRTAFLDYLRAKLEKKRAFSPADLQVGAFAEAKDLLAAEVGEIMERIRGLAILGDPRAPGFFLGCLCIFLFRLYCN